MVLLILVLEFIIFKINILLGILYEKGEVIKLIETGNYYNKYKFKNDKGDKFLIYINKNLNIENNAIISFEGNLELPDKQRNRGGFDYSKYLYSQNIYGSIYIDNSDSIEFLNIKKFNLITYIQESILRALKTFLPQEQLGIVLGMIIGDTFYISDEVENSFKLSGITHLLAVSGSNVTYIILMTKFLFDKIFGKSGSNFITIITIILFVLISGASPSVVRAGIMAILLIVSEILSRAPNTISTIFITALLILLFNPVIICDIGFLLSFGGTLGIVLYSQMITEYLNNKFYKVSKSKIFKYFLESFAVTCSAQIILMPIMWYYFNNISLISLITNLLVSPFVSYVTILGLAMYLLSLICLPLTKLLSYCVYVLVSLIIYISKICSKIPYGNIILPTPTIIIIFIYYLIVYVCFEKYHLKSLRDKHLGNEESNFQNKAVEDNTLYLFKKKQLKFSQIIISVLIIAQIIIYIIPKNYIEINAIDVGQGDSMLIKSNYYNILIDGGGSENSDYDVGNNVLVPYLLDNTNGIIDLMIISHFHEDHAEGCISVLRELKVKKIVIGIQPKTTKLYESILKISKEKNIPIITLAYGDNINLGDIKFEILYPKKELDILEDLNNNSLVIKMIYYNTSLLLTGDIEEESEKLLLKNESEIEHKNGNEKTDIKNYIKSLDSDILKVGHHGSRTSSSQNFLEAVSPQIALISLGEENKFGHPHEEVISRLEDINCQIYRTDEYGEISLKVYRNGKVKINTCVKK